MPKKNAVTAQIGECFIVLHETGENPDMPNEPGKIAIHRGRGNCWLTYSEFLQLSEFVQSNLDLANRELESERKKAMGFNRVFGKVE